MVKVTCRTFFDAPLKEVGREGKIAGLRYLSTDPFHFGGTDLRGFGKRQNVGQTLSVSFHQSERRAESLEILLHEMVPHPMFPLCPGTTLTISPPPFRAEELGGFFRTLNSR